MSDAEKREIEALEKIAKELELANKLKLVEFVMEHPQQIRQFDALCNKAIDLEEIIQQKME